MKAEDMPPYRHTAERLAELEQAITSLQTWRDIGEKRDAALQMRIAALEGEITAIPFYARKIADLEAQVKQLESDRDELFLAMERARIPRYPV